MAKETQKEKIERLEKSLNNANNIIQQLNNEISASTIPTKVTFGKS